MPSMEEARRFAGEDPQCENPVLELCFRAAQDWYRRAGVPPREFDSEYDYWVYYLTSWKYDNRGAGAAEAPPCVLSSLHQLRRREVKAP